MNDLPDIEHAQNACLKCGAPTGGWPCETANPSGLSCRNLLELEAAVAKRDWAEYERLAAAIVANHPDAADSLAAGLEFAKASAGDH